jgi:hypothetical protein
MNCEPYGEWIREAALGALEVPHEAQLKAHLAECQECRESFAAEQRLLAAIEQGLAATPSGKPSPEFAARVRMRLAAGGQSMRPEGRWRPGFWIPASVVGLAALAALILAIWPGWHARTAPPPANKVARGTAPGTPASMAGLSLVGTAKASAPFISSPAWEHASHIAARPERARKRGPARPEDQPPQFQVLVEPGQWRAIVAAYRAAQSGRVVAESLAEKTAQDQQPISLKPVEITPVTIAELYPVKPTEPAER